MSNEDSLLVYLAGGGKLSAPDNAPPRYRAELMRLMAVFVDSELAGATGFADCINLAPGVRERITAARIVLEKLRHAEMILRLLEQFGANTAHYVSAHPWAARRDRGTDLGTRRIDGDMRLNVFHYPIYGWVDAIVLNFLMGRASVIQIDELAGCSYQPLADAMTQILPIELRHAELGEKGLRQRARRRPRPHRRPGLGELLVPARRRHLRPRRLPTTTTPTAASACASTPTPSCSPAGRPTWRRPWPSSASRVPR